MPKLFHLYSNRDRILNRSVTMMRDMYEHYHSGPARLAINRVTDPLERAQSIALCNDFERLYKEAYDVLRTVLFHSKSCLLQDIEWRNEFDIPLEVFEHAIGTAITRINFYLRITDIPEMYKPNYWQQEALLRELLEYRRANDPQGDKR